MALIAASFWNQASGRWQTLVVVIVAAIVLALGMRLPLPFPALAAVDPQTASRLIMFGFSASAWFTAVAVIELFAAAFVRIRNSELCAGQHADPYSRGAIVLTLVISGVTSLSTAANFFNVIAGDRTSLGAADLAIPCVSSVAATAVLVGLGKVVNHTFPGLGFWTILMLLNLSGVSQDELWLLDAYLKLAVSAKSILIVAASTLLIVLIAVWQFRLIGYRSRDEANANLFPWLAAGVLPSHILSLLPASLIQSSFIQEHVELSFAVVRFLLVAGLAAVYFRRANKSRHLLPSICAWLLLLAIPIISRLYNAEPLFDAMLALLLALSALRLQDYLETGLRPKLSSLRGD